MRLSWNEVRVRAAAFAHEWRDAAYEKGETQSFYNEFFEVFGVRRRTVARYEEHVAKLDSRGFIDLFWLVWCLTNMLVLLAVGCVALPRVVTATRAGLKPAPTSLRDTTLVLCLTNRLTNGSFSPSAALLFLAWCTPDGRV